MGFGNTLNELRHIATICHVDMAEKKDLSRSSPVVFKRYMLYLSSFKGHLDSYRLLKYLLLRKNILKF